MGTLDAGKVANFLITSGPVFSDKSVILYNYVQGKPYAVKEDSWQNVAGTYEFTINGPNGTEKYTLKVKSPSSAQLVGKDTLNTLFNLDGRLLRLGFAPMATPRRQGGGEGTPSPAQTRLSTPPSQQLPASAIRLSGVSSGLMWQGTGLDSLGNTFTWSAVRTKEAEDRTDSVRRKPAPVLGTSLYPFLAYGNKEMPKAENMLIRR